MRNSNQQCFFCSQNINEINYKDLELISRFTSSQAKIIDPMHTKTCASHQRKLAKAIKLARHMALLPFVSR